MTFFAIGKVLSIESKDNVTPSLSQKPRIKYIGSVKEIFKDQYSIVNRLLELPFGIAIGKDGRIWVTCRKRILSFDLISKKYSIIGEKELKSPIGIAISSDGRIFVTDGDSSKIFIYTEEGRYEDYIQDSKLLKPGGIDLDEKNGVIYVVDIKGHSLRAYSLSDYKPLKNIGSRGINAEGRFNFPVDVALGKEGTIYVVDAGNFRVQVLNEKGEYIRSIGRIGDVPGTFGRPKGIAQDPEGNIYVSDSLFRIIQVFDNKGRLLSYFGGGTENAVPIGIPAGIAVDSSSRIYIVDQLGDIKIFEHTREGL